MIHVEVMLLTAFLASGLETVTIDSVVIAGDRESSGVCFSVQDSLQLIREQVKPVVDVLININQQCGGGLWSRVAHLNMSDPSQQCPSAWRKYNTSGIRACGRPVTSGGSCPSITYSTNQQYNKVCGRVIGYQVASPDAFNTEQIMTSIDGFYVDGVSITHGSPREHIWSYVGSWFENRSNHLSACPCGVGIGTLPPKFVGNNYYCESGNLIDQFEANRIYSNDKLWDGKQCENEGTCCTTKSPPWFTVELTYPTTDDIEIRICGSQGTGDEDTPIELLEVYVQ